MELFQFYPEMGVFQPIVIKFLLVLGFASFVWSVAITFSSKCRRMWKDVLKKYIFRIR